MRIGLISLLMLALISCSVGDLQRLGYAPLTET